MVSDKTLGVAGLEEGDLLVLSCHSSLAVGLVDTGVQCGLDTLTPEKEERLVYPFHVI